MSGFGAIIRREFGANLRSPMIYVYLSMFSVVCGYFFYRNYLFFSLLSLQSDFGVGRGAALNITEAVFQPLFSNYVFVFLFFVPLVTMRAFSEEKKSSTLELLLSYPVRPIEVVLAKLAAAYQVILIGIAATLLFPMVAAFFGRVEAVQVTTAYLGLSLVALAFCAVGLFFSSVTENQIIAAVLTFATLLLLWALGWTGTFVPGTLGTILDQLSIYNHFRDFNRGVINVGGAIFFLNVTFLFVVLTYSNLQRHSWKG